MGGCIKDNAWAGIETRHCGGCSSSVVVTNVADVVLAPLVASAVCRLEPRELRSCQLTIVCCAFSETTEPAHLRLDLK